MSEDKNAPIFTREQVLDTPEFLVKLLRIIFYSRKITRGVMFEFHRRFWMKADAGDHQQMTADRNNLRRDVLFGQRITWNRFRNIIESLMELPIVKISITVKDPVHGLITYSTDDPLEPHEAESHIGKLTLPD